MKKAIVVYNFTQDESKFTAQIDLFVRAFARIHIDLISTSNANIEETLKKYRNIAFILFYDKDIRLAYDLESRGYAVYNNSEAIRLCDDKGLTYVALKKSKIPVPKTIVLPDSLGKNLSLYLEFITPLVSQLAYPFILKERVGSFGDQVYMVNNKEELIGRLQILGNKPLLIQEYIAHACGKDYRAFVVGNRYVVVAQRVNFHDFRSNVNQGGVMSLYDGSQYAKIRKLALKSAKAVGAKFAGVDIIFDEKRHPLVLEVNSNARTGNISEATKQDVTLKIAKFIKKDSR